ncbi:hypothetical protein KDD30_20445 (plasmid) [Photobacterium sp. GJ3]|uniref:hypothetical protein n=1 Tax=Photobacterium sp. GJ3 TaxID=2829502 RepID=UPI001B8B18A3|nr:hypothetical protein [Photobacterium sp. GJ3]QUJ70465.1 hypothetical protein KDD30_20445 [Photobacterium sp. GJ3]
MNKTLMIIGCLILLYAFAAFMADLLPIYAFQSSPDDVYLKLAFTDDHSFDWTQFRFHTFAIGAVLVAIGMFVGGKGSMLYKKADQSQSWAAETSKANTLSARVLCVICLYRISHGGDNERLGKPGQDHERFLNKIDQFDDQGWL